MIEFLQNIPCFKSQTRKAIMRYTHFLKPVKFLRGQTVYSEGDLANCVYIVFKGEFELVKKLPKPDRLSENKNALNPKAGANKPKQMQRRNILAKRLPEIKDLPYSMRLSIFGKGSLVGEEDVFSRSRFSCTLKCYSSKGTVYELPKE